MKDFQACLDLWSGIIVPLVASRMEMIGGGGKYRQKLGVERGRCFWKVRESQIEQGS